MDPEIGDDEPSVSLTVTKTPIRVGIAGAGWVSDHHLQAWGTLADRAKVVAIADPARGAAAARARQYHVPAAYESVEAMLKNTELDAIDVAASRDAHATICRMAAQDGLAILCQKPLAPTLAEAESLVRDLAALGRGRSRLMVNENWRFRPHYRQISSWITEGRVGEIRTAVMQVFTSGLLPDAAGALPALVRQPMLAGLERMLLMEVMIHHVDTLRFLVGAMELKGVRLGRSCAAIRGEDSAMLFLRGTGGCAVSITGDFMAHGYPAEQMDRLDLLGTKGAIRLRGDELVLSGAGHKVVTLDLAANYRASYRDAITHFVDRLRDGGPFETSPEDHLETLRIVEAAYQMSG